MLVVLSAKLFVAVMKVTVSVAIMQLEVSATLMQVKVSAAGESLCCNHADGIFYSALCT